MGNRSKSHFFFIALVLLSTIAVSASKAFGIVIRVLPLDSLVYDATEIIEAHIIGPRQGRPYWVGNDVKITAVYQGNLKVGDTCVVCGISDNYKGGRDWIDNGKPVGAGDDVILFLKRDANPGLKPYESVVYGPLSSGVRWVDANRVISFGQRTIPGAMFAMREDPKYKIVNPPLEEFRKSLLQTIAEISPIRARLASPLDARDAPWFLQTLADRMKRTPPPSIWNDDILIALGNSIGRLRNPQTALEALRICPHIPVGIAFASPEGRDFLLAKFESPDTSDATRITLLQCIISAGENHNGIGDPGTFGDPENYPDLAGRSQPFGAGNASYITRVVRDVLPNANKPGVWGVFENLLTFWMRTPENPRDPEYLKDITSAAAMLSNFHKTQATPRQQFDIEAAMAKLGRAEYEALGPTQSPVDAIAEFDANYSAGRLPPPYVLVTYSYFHLPWIQDSTDEPNGAQAILKSAADGKEIVIDANPASADMQGFRGTGTFANGPRPLPKNLRAGRYQIFVRFFRDKRIISESHGFEIDQNGNPFPPTTNP